MSDHEIQKLTELLTEVRLELTQIKEKLINKYDEHEKRIEKIEGHLTWLNRIVIGAIIIQLLGLAFIKN